MRKNLFKLLFSWVSIASLFVQVLFPLTQIAHVSQAYAQEVSPTDTSSPTPTDTVSPTDTSTPTPADTITPTVTPDDTGAPTTTPTDSITPSDTTTPTPSDSLTPSDNPTDTLAPTTDNSDNTSSQGPPASNAANAATPTVTPTVMPTNTQETGNLNATVLSSISTDTTNSVDFSTTQTNNATLTTDKPDYSPTDTALISGSNFTPNHTLSLTISSTDIPATSTTVQVTTDNNGSFVYAYQLDGNYRPNYTVVATDAGTTIATTTFTDGAASLDQFDDVGGNWQNGDLNSSNYREGDSVPYRMLLSGLSTSGSHTLIIQWDTTKSGKHAIDYITTFNRTVSSANPCLGVSGCGSPTTFAIPNDPNVTGAGVTPVAGSVFTIYNGTITSVSSYTLTGTYSGDSSTSISITFTASNSTPVIAWGGHIGSQIDWGTGNSASGISGSPYHTRLISIDGSGGNQDRSLKASAVLPVPGLATQVSSSSIVIGQSITDTATYTEMSKCGSGNQSCGTVSGSTQFYECAGSTPCTSTANPVGSAVTNSSDHATSLTFTPQATGTYCFAAYYTPDANAQYSPIDSTVITNECVTVSNPPTGTLTVTKVTNPNDTSTLFSITASGSGTITGNATQSIKTGSPVAYTVTAGTYTVTESALSGWSQTGNTCSNVSVAAGGSASCTITNTKLPTLKLVKNVSNTHGGSATPSQWTLSATGSSSSFSDTGNSTTFHTVTNGVTYTLGESGGPSGYQAGTWTCDNNVTVTNSQISLSAGQNVTCSITNSDIAPSLTLVKQVSGGTASASAWTLTATGTGGSPTNLSGTTPVVSGSNFKADTYTLAEANGPSGYTATTWSCTNSVTVTNSQITLPLGKTTTCTITNTRDQGTIELKKVWSGTAGQTTLNIGSSANGTDIASVQTGANGTGPLTTTAKTVNTGTYYVSEAGELTNYTSGLVCTDNNNAIVPGTSNSITVNKGDTVVCTFTNTRNTGTITVKKILSPSFDQGTFNLQVDGTTKATGGDGTTTNAVTVDTGSHSVAETSANNTVMANYTSTYSCTNNGNVLTSGSGASVANLTVNANDNVVCTFTNTRNTADLKVIKIVDDGSPLTDWTFSVDNGNGVTADAQGNVDLGPVTTNANHTITEGGANQGNYTLVSVTGTNCSIGNTGNSGTVNIPNGSTGTTCTFANNRNTGTIQVAKVVSPHDNGATSWDFAISGPSNNSVLGLHDGDTSSKVTSYTGNYTITESGTNLSNYTTTYSCTDGTNPLVSGIGTSTYPVFTVQNSHNVVCTFTNTIKPGSITVIKYNDLNANGAYDQGEPTLSGWTMNIASIGAQVTANGSTTFSNVLPGTYTLSETQQNGWIQSNISCGQDVGIDNDNSHPVTVIPNATTTCYVGNYQDAHVIVTKDVLDPDGNPITDTSTSFGFTLGTQTTNLTDGQSNNFTVSPGTFAVTETPNANYTFGQCTSSDDPLSGGLTPLTDGYSSVATSGETIHITCTNLQKKAIITVNKNVVASDGITSVNDNHSFSVTVNGVTKSFAEGQDATFSVNPGTYAASEGAETNYTLVSNDGPATVPSNGSTTIHIVNKQNPGEILGAKTDATSGNGIPNWVIDLFTCDSSFLNCVLSTTTSTDGNGNYSFGNLVTGFYQVAEELKTGWTAVGNLFYNVTITPGHVDSGDTFVNFHNVTISGHKFDDANGDRVWDNGESPLQNWTFDLEDTKGNVITTGTTDVNGLYTFSNLGPGTYRVREENQTGWTQTTANPADITVSSGQDVENVDFGNQGHGSIKFVKFYDANNNGIQDNSEPTLPGWEMNVDGIGSQTTGNDGTTTFTNVAEGTYAVNETLQDSWTQTTFNCDNTTTFEIFGENLNLGNGTFARILPGQTTTCVVGNYTKPVLTITKTNDKLGIDQAPGDAVLYTLTITATQAAAENVVLTDLLPKGFAYRNGSATIDNGSGPQTFTNFSDDYHSPGIWNLGTIQKGQTLTLTLIADISGSQNSGLYKDVAYAQGQSLAGDTVEADAGDPSVNPGNISDPNFVGTQVNVVTQPSNGATFAVAQNNSTQDVLGAATSALPETGANTIWVILASFFLLVGMLAISTGFVLKKRYV